MKRPVKKLTKNIKKLLNCHVLEETKILEFCATLVKKGLGAFHNIQQDGEWKPIIFASTLLTNFEAKYSINKLELINSVGN